MAAELRIDLSVALVIAFTAMASAAMVEKLGLSPLVAIPVVLLMGSALGAGMGALIHYFKIPPFIATLAGMFLARGACFVISRDAISIDDLTADARYLTMAKSIFNDMKGGWSTQCNGGIWWNKTPKYKNAIANELFLTVAVRLHQRTPGTTRDAYARIEAERFNAQQGTITEATTDVGGGQNIGAINNGAYLVYNDVNFGATSPLRVDARVASGAAFGVSGIVEFRLGSPAGTLIGSFAQGPTGGWQAWVTTPGGISG